MAVVIIVAILGVRIIRRGHIVLVRSGQGGHGVMGPLGPGVRRGGR